MLISPSENLSRISLAVDYDGNGYRRLASVGLNDGSLLNALLAMSEAHLGKWQRKAAYNSWVYVRRSMQLLQKRLEKPALMRSEVTLMTILVLLTHEVSINDTHVSPTGLLTYLGRYLGMYRKDLSLTNLGILPSFVKAMNSGSNTTPASLPGHNVSRNSEIDPFLTTLLSMIASQCVLHMRGDFRQQSYRLLETLSPLWVNHGAVDAVLGCSVDLPQLIVSNIPPLLTHVTTYISCHEQRIAHIVHHSACVYL